MEQLMYPKPKHKKQNKRISESKRYSIITANLDCCIMCGRTNTNKHEIFGGNRNRENSKKYGLVIPLCVFEHHNQIECKGIHFDKELMENWHKIGQKVFMEHYNKTVEEFIQIFGKNYL